MRAKNIYKFNRGYFIINFFNYNGVSPGGRGTTIRHNTQITHITQNNRTIKKTQQTKLHTQ
jgi:hypothetical protein